MSRRSRRHHVDDPVAAAQEEAEWSGYTHYFRGGSQGKWIFHRPDPRVRQYRGSWFMGASIGVALILLAGFALWAVVALVRSLVT